MAEVVSVRKYSRRDHDFHTLIIDASKNSQLSKMYESLAVHIQILKMYWGRTPDHALKSHQEHQQILKAFQQNDSEVMTALTDRIKYSENLMLAIENDGD